MMDNENLQAAEEATGDSLVRSQGGVRGAELPTTR